jgi:hypothetical protein
MSIQRAEILGICLLFLMGCYYHVDRDIDYGWFTVRQHDTEYPDIINNLDQTLTVEIYVPDADFSKWFRYKTLVIKPHGKGRGVNFLRLDLIYYQFWVLESHKVDMLGSEGQEL